MPIYTYRCENCGVQFDVTQKFSDNSLTQCPECGKKALRKVYTPVGIVFKGSGFYATDNHSPSGQSWASGAKEPTESTAESKPAASKAEAKKPAESAKPAAPTTSSSGDKA
jgi:putative FmdB family regulatory protein